jgi:ribosomal-protein-alanine N-acetyltransferase
VEIRRAQQADLEAVAAIFHAAFPESVSHIWGADKPPALELTATLFALCLESEPEAFLAAEIEGSVAGYIFAPTQLSRIWRVAVRRGWVWRWMVGWVTGRYGLGWRPVRLALANKVSFLRHAMWDKHRADARILSLAVHPGFQGRGVASRLCEAAMQRFDRLAVKKVRLEVRPENTPAVKLYSRLGFKRVGSMADTQGEWWVMIKY